MAHIIFLLCFCNTNHFHPSFKFRCVVLLFSYCLCFHYLKAKIADMEEWCFDENIQCFGHTLLNGANRLLKQ